MGGVSRVVRKLYRLRLYRLGYWLTQAPLTIRYQFTREGRISHAQWLLRRLRSPAAARDALYVEFLEEFACRVIHAHAVDEILTGRRLALPKPGFAPKCGRRDLHLSIPASGLFATRWGWSTDVTGPVSDSTLAQPIVAACLNCGLKRALPLSAIELPPDVIERVERLFKSKKREEPTAIMGGHGQEPRREET